MQRAKTKAEVEYPRWPLPAARNKHFYAAFKSVPLSDFSHFVISMVMPRECCWGDCCTIFHQDTELSHTYHISLSSCFPLCCLFLPRALAPLLSLFLHIAASHSSIPLAFMFAFIPTSLSLLLGELHTVAFPLVCCVHLLVSPFFFSSSPLSPLLSSPLWLCLLLAHPPLLPWIHAFSRGNLFIHPSQLCAPLCLPSCLSVCAVSGSERTGGGARRQE